MIGRKPEPVPGEVPGRWKVERGNSWDGPSWFVFDPDGKYVTNKFGWAEALAYADRMARTCEYVLPRPAKDSYIAVTDEQAVKAAAWIDGPGTICLAIDDSYHYMTPDGAHSIGLALLALAEMEGVK